REHVSLRVRDRNHARIIPRAPPAPRLAPGATVLRYPPSPRVEPNHPEELPPGRRSPPPAARCAASPTRGSDPSVLFAPFARHPRGSPAPRAARPARSPTPRPPPRRPAPAPPPPARARGVGGGGGGEPSGRRGDRARVPHPEDRGRAALG